MNKTVGIFYAGFDLFALFKIGFEAETKTKKTPQSCQKLMLEIKPLT